MRGYVVPNQVEKCRCQSYIEKYVHNTRGHAMPIVTLNVFEVEGQVQTDVLTFYIRPSRVKSPANHTSPHVLELAKYNRSDRCFNYSHCRAGCCPSKSLADWQGQKRNSTQHGILEARTT